MKNIVFTVLFGFFISCSSNSSPIVGTPILDNTKWIYISQTADDLFTSAVTPESKCEDPLYGTYGTETIDGVVWFSVQTTLCNYITVQQPLLIDLKSGDLIQINFYHFSLTAPDPGEAHVALAIDDSIVWSKVIPIPSESSQILETITLDQDFATDTPIQFHINNHGSNSYSLVSAALLP